MWVVANVVKRLAIANNNVIDSREVMCLYPLINVKSPFCENLELIGWVVANVVKGLTMTNSEV